MTDQHEPDGAGDGDGPITPEVVRPRGAAGRKRKAGEPADEGRPGGPVDDLGGSAPSTGGRAGTMVRIAAMLLIALGLMQLFLAGQWVLDPEGARCTAARIAIDAANEDDEDFNDVALPDDVDEVGDLPCAEAIAAAGAIPDDEDDEPEGEFTAASTFRLQGLGIGVIGIAQGVAGFLVLRTQKRVARNVALGAAAAGILLPVLGVISLVALAFVVFALGFSKDAKAIWGGGSFMRPRPSREAT